MLFIENELATYRGAVRREAFHADFRQMFPASLLATLGSDLSQYPSRNWLDSLVSADSRGQHPLRHLLLLQYFGLTVEDLLDTPREYAPFGNGPWSCLNQNCTLFEHPVIHQVAISFNQRGIPVGIFSCPGCGTEYQSTGPGPIKKDAARFEQPHLFTFSEKFSIRLGRYRQKWLTMIKRYPHATRSKLHQVASSVYRWLSINDRDWLEASLPPAIMPVETRTRPWPKHVDWAARDRQISRDVWLAAQALYNNTLGRPVWVTSAALERRVRDLARFSQSLDRLPLTARTLNQVTESSEAVALRRIKWAADRFEHRRHMPTRSEFINKAGVSHHWANPDIQVAIDDALMALAGHRFPTNSIYRFGQETLARPTNCGMLGLTLD